MTEATARGPGRLRGRSAVVTGAAKATAGLFAREMANAILFLASDEASFVTGAILSVDGGYMAQ